MAKSTNTKSPVMDNPTESVGELKVFQLGTKGQTPGEKRTTKQRRGTRRSPKITTDYGSFKSHSLRNIRRHKKAKDQKETRKQRHKNNRNQTPIKSEDSVKTDVYSKVKVHDKNVARGEEKTVNSNLKKGKSGNSEVEDKKKSSREEVVDFSQLDAMILAGKHKDFLGKRVTDEETDATTNTDIIKVQLLMNPRKTAMKVPLVIDVKAVDVREPDSVDMIASIDLVDDETEDKDLIKHENETHWECPKCNQENKNDAGYCANIIDDKLCGGTKKAEKILGWGNCFGPVSNMWKCDACLVKNEESADVCAACEKKRP